MFSRLFVTVLVFSFGLCSHLYAEVSNGIYSISSKYSNKLLQVNEGSTKNAANVSQWPDVGSDNQRWMITAEGDGYYSIINLHSGKALEVYAFNAGDGANVVQYEYWGGDSQLWNLAQDSAGFFSLINKFSGKALALYDFDTADGANVIQSSFWGGDQQLWQITLVTTSEVTVTDTSTTDGPTNHWQLSGDLVTNNPTIAYEGGYWWLFQSGPGIAGKISSDGLQWDTLPNLFPNGLEWWKNYIPKLQGNEVRAPDVNRYKDRVWLYYAISNFESRDSAIGLASASNLSAGDWQDEGLVISTTEASNYSAVDPDLTIDAHGNPWLVFGSWSSGIKLTRLNPITMKPIGTLYSIANRSGGIESPNIIYRQGYYYLFLSVGTCCRGASSTHRISFGRSANVTGPYLDKNGNNLLDGGGSVLEIGNEQLAGPGGQDIANSSVIARQAYDVNSGGIPKLLISTLNWDAEGWPRY